MLKVKLGEKREHFALGTPGNPLAARFAPAAAHEKSRR
jgi:hypothetical protein